MWGSSAGRTSPRLSLLAILLTTAAIGSGCGGSSAASSTSVTPHPTGALNTKRVALAISHSILVERHLHAHVVCPPHVPEHKGVSFTCTAVSHSHHQLLRARFTVFQRNSAGRVYYQSP